MKKILLLSILNNIDELQAIPTEKRTERQEKAIVKMMDRVGQARRHLGAKGLPEWWKSLEKGDLEIRSKIESCFNFVQKRADKPNG